jgi:hypothetical protein
MCEAVVGLWPLWGFVAAPIVLGFLAFVFSLGLVIGARIPRREP